MLEIGWKSFGNRCWPCFKVVENLSTPSVIFGSHREIFGSRWKPLAILGRQSLEAVGKSSESQILYR